MNRLSFDGFRSSFPALLSAALLLLTTGELVAQQEGRPGRQDRVAAGDASRLQSQVQERGGRVIIGFKPTDARRGVTERGRSLLATSEVEAIVEELRPGPVQEVRRRFDLIPAVAAVIDPSALGVLLADPRVDYVEPDYRRELFEGASSEPARSAATLAQNLPWGMVRIQTSEAWGVTLGDGVSVGILDTGIDADHPDLDPLGGVNIVTGGTGTSDWDDASDLCSSHGTHVAGIAAALDNGTGVVGVAPAADLYAVRVFDPEALDLSACFTLASVSVDGIQWAVDNGMDVINLSYGSSFPSVAESDALRVAYHNGVLPVTAAGNAFGGEVIFPAAYPTAVAVSATDRNDNVAHFSSIGPQVEVAAPGVDITSTTNDGGTGELSGTSMASPHAAGVAALIRSAAAGLSVDEARSLLRSTADDVGGTGFDQWSGHGIVNAGRAATVAGGSELAVATVPERLTLVAPPAGAPDTVEMVLESVGDAGLIDWTASSREAWLTVSPDSGQVSGGTPDTLTVVADPADLASRVYEGVVSVDGSASNQPVETPVQLAVARTLPLDSARQVADTLESGSQRIRFALTADSAGQRVDVNVFPSSFDGTTSALGCALARLYRPDGETALAASYGDPAAGVPFSPLMYSVSLPEAGTYLVDVSSFCGFGGGFVVQAREAGPILGFSPAVRPLLRAAEGGTTDQMSIGVSNLSGVDSLGWTASPLASWLTVSPASGTADVSGEVLEFPTASEEFDRRSLPDAVRRRMEEAEERRPPLWESVKGLSPARQERLAADTSRDLEPVLLDEEQREEVAATSETSVTLTADPTGLSLGAFAWFGEVSFTTDNGWVRGDNGVDPRYGVLFRLYTAGMQIGSTRFDWTDDVAYDPPAALDRAVGTAWTWTGSEWVDELRPVEADATVGSAVASGGYGVTTGADGNWLLGEWEAGSGPTVEVLDRAGVLQKSIPIPTLAQQMALGPAGEIYVASLGEGIYRLSPGADHLELWSTAIGHVGGLAYRPQDHSLYVSTSDFDIDVGRIPLDSASTVADTLTMTDCSPQDVAVGASGDVYVTSGCNGVVDRYVPEQSTSAVESFYLPRWGALGAHGLTMIDGALVGTGGSFGEFYTFARADSGARIRPRLSARAASGPEPGLRGDTVEVTVGLNLTRSSEDVSSYASTLSWPSPDTLAFVGAQAADFGGSFQANTANTASGSLDASSSRTDSVAHVALGLYDVAFHVAAGARPGSRYDFTLSFSQLQSSAGTDLTGALTVEPAALCVSAHAYGDVDTDGSLGANDATQILRHALEEFAPVSANIELADVSGDGRVTAGDALQVLRSVVGLSVPATSRVGEYGVASCE